jgi:hypothetical protein
MSLVLYCPYADAGLAVVTVAVYFDCVRCVGALPGNKARSQFQSQSIRRITSCLFKYRTDTFLFLFCKQQVSQIYRCSTRSMRRWPKLKRDTFVYRSNVSLSVLTFITDKRCRPTSTVPGQTLSSADAIDLGPKRSACPTSELVFAFVGQESPWFVSRAYRSLSSKLQLPRYIMGVHLPAVRMPEV